MIANHALVLTQAAFDGARAARGQPADVETTRLKRIVFDEGHHLFDAADSAFAACLSGAEAAEMRRWIRGPEGRGRRGRGLEARLADILGRARGWRARRWRRRLRAAAALPGEGWSGRIAPPIGEASPIGPIEAFLVAALEQLRARAAPSELGHGMRRPAGDRPGARDRGRGGPGAGGGRGAAAGAGAPAWRTCSTTTPTNCRPASGPGSKARCAGSTGARA